MAWDFETDPEFQEKLDWVDQFVVRSASRSTSRSRTCSSTR